MSVSAACRATRVTARSLLVAEDGLADTQPAVQLELRLGHLPLVHERAVGAAQVLDVVVLAAGHEPRVGARHELFVEHDVARGRAAHRDPAFEGEDHAGRHDGAVLHDEARVDVRREVQLLAGHGAFRGALLAPQGTLRRRRAGDLARTLRQGHVRGRGGRARDVAHSGAHHHPDEEVHEHHDGDLQHKQDDVDHPPPPVATAAALVRRLPGRAGRRQQGVAFRDQLVELRAPFSSSRPSASASAVSGGNVVHVARSRSMPSLTRGEMLHVAEDALLAAAEVVEQVRPHGGPAQAGAVAHGPVHVLHGGDAAQHEVHGLAPQRGGEPVGEVAGQVAGQLDRLLADAR